MLIGGNNQADKLKGKKTNGFSSLTYFIQPARMENSVWAGKSAIN